MQTTQGKPPQRYSQTWPLAAVTTDLTRKVPPHDIEAEQLVLGGILADNEVFHEVAEVVRAEDFYSPAHRIIFEAIASMIRNRQPADLLTVANALRETGHLDEVGGAVYLAEVAGDVIGVANAEAHASIVASMAMRRTAILAGARIVQRGYDPTCNPEELIASASLHLAEVKAQRDQAKAELEIVTAADILDMEFRDPPLIGGLLDERESLLICGPSGLGKSVLTFNLALTIATAPPEGLWGLFPIPRPLRTVFFQAENGSKAMQARFRMIIEAAPELRPGLDNLFFRRIKGDCRASGSLEDEWFRAGILEALQAVQADILVLDPLISFHGADENDNAAMRHSLDALTALCDEANVACIVVHHVGKAGSDNAVFAGRGASAIGDWAANILMMAPTEDENKNRTSIIEMRHTKSRNFEARPPFYLDRRPDLTMLRVVKPLDPATEERMEMVTDCLRGMGGQADSQTKLEKALTSQMGSRSTAQRAIEDALKRRLIRKGQGHGRAKIITLNEAASPTLPIT